MYTVFPKMHFCCIFSSSSPCFFTLLSYTYSESNLLLYVYTPPLLYMTSLHMLRDIAFLFVWFICLFVHPFMRYLLWIITHNPFFFLSFFISCFFLSLSLSPSTKCVQKHLCTTLWMVFLFWH
jgi:hypothetical protein